MNTTLAPLDLGIFSLYLLFIVALGIYLGRKKRGGDDTRSFFLAGNSLPWWAVGSGLIAANISAEQLIGTTGASYAMGIAIASWEWLAIPAILLAAKWTVPYFIKHDIRTMPAFLERRYDRQIRTLFALFWVVVYVFINLTAVAYMGALSLNAIMDVPLDLGIAGMLLVALAYSFTGGFAAIAWTNFIQVAILILGGLVTLYLSLQAVAGLLGADTWWHGMTLMLATVPEHFHLVLAEDNANFQYIPGARGIFGGMAVICLFGWCFNQFIVQNALAAKSTREAQKGLLFAAALKLLMPAILVLPGIAAYLLTRDGQQLSPVDQAYPWLINQLIPAGFKGLILAALAAAIISTLSALLNSAATLFVVDIYQTRLAPGAGERHSLRVARIFMVLATLTAMALARPMLEGFEQAYQFVQEFVGFVMPGMLCIFLFGIAWRKATAQGAKLALLLSVGLSLLIKLRWPELPHLDRTGLVFLCCAVAMVATGGMATTRQGSALILSPGEHTYQCSRGFYLGSLGLMAALVATYTLLW